MSSYHHFHIPVMGTGHSADTPIRVAPFGIDSVVSLVDDILLEKIRKYYAEDFNLPFQKISGSEEDGRAKRITAYLDMVGDIVTIKLNAIKNQPFFQENDKKKYFDLLPDDSILKLDYLKLLKMKAGEMRIKLEDELTNRMQPGAINVNIMVKLDRVNFKGSQVLSEAFSDAKAALRGFANSKVESSIVFSAGINQSLFTYMSEFQDFYRNEIGDIKKKIVIKVSDFRSAMIQAKTLAKKGLEVYEFRIESGLNCGGHAFATNGTLLPTILKKFKDKREELAEDIHAILEKYYSKNGLDFFKSEQKNSPLVTVQGGIGNSAEAQRLMEDFKTDKTGWATPFLLVPEATCVDDPTLDLLKNAKLEDTYLSDISPLGVPFNNVRNTGSELWTQKRVDEGKPGSPCPKGFLISNTEFTDKPICTASIKYQTTKLDQIQGDENLNGSRDEAKTGVVVKACICDHLGNGALLKLGLREEKRSPQSVCPGPNIAWFDRKYSLAEMVDHIYGRTESLVPGERPHMFAKELEMYVDHFEKISKSFAGDEKEHKKLVEFYNNLNDSMVYCLDIATSDPYPGENLESIKQTVEVQTARLNMLFSKINSDEN